MKNQLKLDGPNTQTHMYQEPRTPTHAVALRSAVADICGNSLTIDTTATVTLNCHRHWTLVIIATNVTT